MSGAALVVGGASGIGRACAEALAAAGWPTVVADLKPDPDDATAIAVDVRDREAAAAAVATVVASHGGDRHPRLRRRHRPRHPGPGDRAARVGAGHRRQPRRRLQLPPGRRPPDPRRRLLHRDLLDRLRRPGPRARPLLRQQGRPRGAGPLRRAGARPRRRALQRGPARPRPHAADGADAGPARRRGRLRRPDPAARDRRRAPTSPRSSPSSPRPPRAGSPAPRSRSTAACP